MRAIAALVACSLAVCSLAVLPACTKREVTPPPAAPAAPVSSFTAVDATEVANALAESATRNPWAGDFHAKNGRPAAVAIGVITDKSGDHVDTAALADELARALGRSDQVTVAPAGQPGDVSLGGTINLSHAHGDAYYQIDLRIVAVDGSATGGDALWLDGIERRQSAVPGAPVLAPTAKP